MTGSGKRGGQTAGASVDMFLEAKYLTIGKASSPSFPIQPTHRSVKLGIVSFEADPC